MENNPLLDISRISGKRGSKKSEDRQLMEECRFHIGDVVQHFKRENVNLETAEYLYRLRHHFIWQNYFSHISLKELPLLIFHLPVTVWVSRKQKVTLQQPVHRVGNPMDIANMVLFLCSEKQALSQVKTFVLTVVWQNKWFSSRFWHCNQKNEKIFILYYIKMCGYT